MVVLSAPASDEVPILLRRFLEADSSSLLISRSLSSAEPVLGSKSDGLKCLVCSDKPVPPAQNTLPGKGIENLTELSLTITETINSLQPSRVVVQFLSDVLLRHKALQTRKWLSELLDKFRAKNITTLVVLNPFMHAPEEVQAIVDLFNGNIELIEKQVEGQVRKTLVIKWMHGIETTEKEFQLIDLTTEPQTQSSQVAVPVGAFKEPRWTTPLISRTEELSRLRGLFDNALMTRSKLVALRGEIGVGKSRLMHELAVHAQTKGTTILSGRGSEVGLPYAPWVDVTRQYTASTPGEVLRRMLGANASEIVKLVPDLAAKLGTIPPPRSLGEAQDKIRFYETVTQFLIAIINQTPLLLLFEDMQYADQPSLELLEYFVRSTNNLRVLTVCSSPPQQAAEPSPLEQVFLKLNRERMLEDINVKNLGMPETVELIKATFGEQTVSPEFTDLIYQHTAGNPFFVEEVLRSLVENGTIFRTEKGWDRKPIQGIAIPQTVKNALKARLTKLDQETVNVLTMAAVIGSEFDFQILTAVTQPQGSTLLDRIEKALSSGLILEDEHRQGILTFTDVRVREILLDDLSRLRRTGYHLKIAEAMEKTYAKNLETQAESIAAHYSEAGNKDLALKYSIMAGDRNRLIYAHEQAAKDYARALTLLGEGKDAEKAAILEKLARSYDSAGKFQVSLQTYEQAIAFLEKLKDLKSCARMIPGFSAVVFRSKGPREAAGVARQALKYLEGEAQDSSEAAKIYSNLSKWLSNLDEYEEANVWAKKALEVGEKSGNFGAVAESLLTMGTYFTDTGRVDEGIPLLEKSLEIASQHELYFDTWQILYNLTAYAYPRDLTKARSLALRFLEFGKGGNDVNIQANAQSLLSYFDWLSGDWAGAVEKINRAFEVRKRLGFTAATFVPEVCGGTVYLSLGDVEQAEKYLQMAESRNYQQITQIVQTNLLKGKLRLAHGNEKQAQVCLEKCVDAFKNTEFTTYPLLHVESLQLLTSIHAKQGRVAEAMKMSDWAGRLAGTLKSDAGLAMAKEAQANVLLAKGERDGALETYRVALGFWGKAGWLYYHSKALVAYSEAIAETNPEESRKRLKEAIETFRKLGAKRDLEKAEVKLPSKT
jgi:hypothetical protein